MFNKISAEKPSISNHHQPLKSSAPYRYPTSLRGTIEQVFNHLILNSFIYVTVLPVSLFPNTAILSSTCPGGTNTFESISVQENPLLKMKESNMTYRCCIFSVYAFLHRYHKINRIFIYYNCRGLIKKYIFISAYNYCNGLFFSE